MKKLVGFIFMLVLSLTLSMTAYAADDLGSIVAKMSTDKKKDKKKKKKKKKVKKSKKNKKKGKKGKKKAKKVKKDTQSSLKPSEVVEEVLDDYSSNEEEKKDLPVVELKVKSASKIWTNEVDITKINIEKTLNELLIGEKGYPSAPAEVIALNGKYHDGDNSYVKMETAAGVSSNYLIRYHDSFYTFKFISKDSLYYLEIHVEEKSDLSSYDLNDFLSSMRAVGLNLEISQKQLDTVVKGELKARFVAGTAAWDLTGHGGTLSFERVEKNSVNFTMSDVFKACAKHRLVFINNFYSKFSKLMNSGFIVSYNDNDSNYKYNDRVRFMFSSITEGELGVDSVSYVDDAERHKTTLQIAGNINIDTRVEELAKILDEYTGVDLYTFDTSRIENMLKGDAVQEFSVDLECDLGDTKVEVSVVNDGEKTFQFSVIFTRKY
jgi:hypothetical protein